MEEDEKEKNGCDFYHQFIKGAIDDLKKNGICYVFHKYQVDEILKIIGQKVDAVENDCGYTLNIPRKKRKYDRICD